MKGAKKLQPAPGQRLCIHESAGFVMDVPGATLCFGTFRASTPEEIAADPNNSPIPFIHAWAEWQGLVWSPTIMSTCPIEAYYEANGATDIKRLTRPALLAVARRIGLSRHLRLGVPTKGGASVGQSLLEAAGKEYRTIDNALLPPEAPNA
jgi:hypothetical protein